MDSGNVYKHPFKRARTTGTYLAAATMGTDADRALIRAEVDRVHALVRSNASSPMSYNAFDPRLQLWVAACLYRYLRRHSTSSCTARSTRRPPKRSTRTPESSAPRCRCATGCGRPIGSRSTSTGSARSISCGSTRPCASTCTASRRWPSCPLPLRLLAGRFNLFATHGISARRSFASTCSCAWTAGQQRRFEWLLSGLRLADRVIPRDVWMLGYQLYLWDMRISRAARQAGRLDHREGHAEGSLNHPRPETVPRASSPVERRVTL